jgi:CRISPR-associated endonuclease/helicase Cas3
MGATMGNATEGTGDFKELVRRATDREPFPYQARLAEEGFPEALVAPTGSGKTLAVVLAWLYRRRFHPDPQTRAATPHWLVFTLPMRVLVEQVADDVARWLRNLDLEDEVGVHVALGGWSRRKRSWRQGPEQDAVLVGTLDMLLSRALNRGYGDGRWMWPVDFGLLNNGTLWVFDEVQLMGEAFPTSRQLQGLRDTIGTLLPTASMWMSATLDFKSLSTVDKPWMETAPVLRLSDADLSGELGVRVRAGKTVEELQISARRDKDGVGYAKRLAEEVLRAHREGTRTLVVVNTVQRAREVAKALREQVDPGATSAEVVLLHSRFRPPDRAEATKRALADMDVKEPGRVVVCTQVVEAGVDVSSATLITELAPRSSIVQRAGRCNRYAERDDARLLWVRPPDAPPYDDAELEEAAQWLNGLAGKVVTPFGMTEMAVDVGVRRVRPRHVLRRRDLIELFDTLPDLSGADVDVSRFIRSADDIDVEVAWRTLPDDGPRDGDSVPATDERCRVPVSVAREWLQALAKQAPGQSLAWRVDHLARERQWVRCGPEELVPGLVLLVDAKRGGYDRLSGFDPSITEPVEAVDEARLYASGATPKLEAAVEAEDLATGNDPGVATGRCVSLAVHL